MADNKRYIDIDADTRVGFNYIKQQFYVTNKEYTTYRTSVEGIQGVLAAIGVTSVTDEQLLELKAYTEDLYKVTYTLQDTGAYIHTLQFNDFKNYPLTIDCEKAKLYIMNSTIIYDLTLNESPRNVRIPRILSFYKDTCGLLISTQDMCYFYSLLLSYYYPICYNQVMMTSTGKYFYNNKFILSNYSGTSNATYTCTYNPENTAKYTNVGYVLAADTATNTMTTSAPVEDYLQGYDTVIVSGANTYIASVEQTYSADGTYTIDSIDGNVITVEETLPYAYEFNYKECYVVASAYGIESMSRDNNTITIADPPNNILVGDVILVEGTNVETAYETLSCDGTYTVQYIEDNVITVEEQIPTDFTAEAGSEAGLIKEIFVSNIASIDNKVLTLTDTTDLDLTGATLLIHTIGDIDTDIQPYTVTTFTTGTITVAEDVDDYSYMDSCGILQIPVPSEEAPVLVDVTSVSDNAAEVFPLGEFMVDNFEQCQDYIGTLAKLVKPSAVNKENLYKELPEEMELGEIPDLTTARTSDKISCSIPTMQFKGLYSKVYSE